MLKRLLFIVFIFCIGLATAGAYTVILKNGKTMNGTLISETEQILMFKDGAGVQYSLKKSSLDLDQMREANAPKVEPPPPVMDEGTAKEAPKKKARVYTKEDVDSLRTKYPELSLGEPVENPEDYEAGVLKPEAYGKRIQQGATVINDNIANLAALREGVATAWEVAASTGKDPSEAVATVLNSEKSAEALKGVSDDLMVLGRWQESMTNPPDNVKDAYNTYVRALAGLSDFQRGLTSWNTFENVNLFRSRLSELESQISVAVSQIQASTAQPQPEPAPENPDQQESEDQQPPTQ